MGTMIAFAGLDSGKVDIHPEVWLPNLDNPGQNDTSQRPRPCASAPRVCRRLAGYLREPRGGRQIRNQGQFGISTIRRRRPSSTPMATARARCGSARGTWSSTTIEKHPRQSYGYAKTMTLLEMPEDVGMAAVDAAEATGPADGVCLLRPACGVQAARHRPAEGAGLRSRQMEDRAALRRPGVAVEVERAGGWDASHYHIAYATSLAQAPSRRWSVSSTTSISRRRRPST